MSLEHFWLGVDLIGLRLSEHFPDIFASLCILVAGFVFYKVTAPILRKVLLRTSVDDTFARLLIDSAYKFVIIVLVLITVATQLGINVVAPLAGIGILGIAFGFAAQDSLSNIVAGFLIFTDKPFRVRDYVTIGEHYGRIELITMRSTRIRTQDNMYVVIPNQKIINEVLVDHSTNGDTRLNIPVSIAYEASIEDARTAILGALAQIDGIAALPAPDVVVDELGESGVKLLVRFWIPNADKERKYHFLGTETVKRALDEGGIAIAYPHLKLVNDTKKPAKA